MKKFLIKVGCIQPDESIDFGTEYETANYDKAVDKFNEIVRIEYNLLKIMDSDYRVFIGLVEEDIIKGKIELLSSVKLSKDGVIEGGKHEL